MKVRLRTSLSTIFNKKLIIPKSYHFPPSNSSESHQSTDRTRRRNFTTSQAHRSNPSSKPDKQPQPSPSHWLSLTKARIGKCISFGLTRPQCQNASTILSILSTEWRSLLAGREGFLSSPKRAGLLRHRVVWGEMDSMGHVNNVMYVRYAESARINWAWNIAMYLDPGRRREWSELWTPRGEGLILRSMRTEYKFPMKFPDRISVFHKLRSDPSSSSDPTSFILDVLILSELHQRPAARCEEDIVIYDYRAGKKAPMSGFVREGFEKIWKEQEEEKTKALARIEEVEGMVRKLERESWDNEGAVEDMGSK